ncbi:hypothetical protein G5V58_15650 [Nocardioides anomalus]|uniref:ABC3 transporter permease C-terminal domain-containing protein n=1 Tax=Nocardioides anomalus TaxID=2712223 RepID=A0A6G6WG44_9ACTN|nr:FtsX-like permease family protein [Nocardioides anomalus]QIG44020.1 hypothetical protein G5V58_15650 [Nocardioides anomalus]
MWSRIRHRRLQALSLVALAALLTTSLGLGPLYQRAMEQAYAGSVLAGATAPERGLVLRGQDRDPEELEGLVPAGVRASFSAPRAYRYVQVSATRPSGGTAIGTRLYTVADACTRLHVVQGRCPSEAGEVMVSVPDAEQNGWALGARVRVDEPRDPVSPSPPAHGRVSVVGVYEPSGDPDWLAAPLQGRVGVVDMDRGVLTDDWVTAPATMDGPRPGDAWGTVTNGAAFPLGPSVDHDELLRLGPAVARLAEQLRRPDAGAPVSVTSSVPSFAREVATGDDQGRTTVVVLSVQLLVLVAVVLWMVLVAAGDDRRGELALARLRGRGRRGAATYLLAELLPLTLAGVLAGALLAPVLVRAIAAVMFPVPVPLEAPDAYLVSAVAAAFAVALVVLVATLRAVREPVGSLLRAVPPRGRTGVVEVVLVAFSLTAVVALVSGTLEGPLATLAPTLLAVAAALLLARGLRPATLLVVRRLLRGGHAVAAAGLVSAVRRPATRRVLVMVVVGVALLVFCVDALVTGQHNRENAAEQANGARYAMDVQASEVSDVIAAVAAADPDGQHLTPVLRTSAGAGAGPTLAVDPVAFARTASFPLSDPGRVDWEDVEAPDVAPLTLTGAELSGTVDADLSFRGVGVSQAAATTLQLQVRLPSGSTPRVDLVATPTTAGSVPFSAYVPCAEGCVVTGLGLKTPPGLEVSGTVVPHDLSLSGQPVDLGGAGGWRRASGDGGVVEPYVDADGALGLNAATTGSAPPFLLNAWVPDPVPAVVTTVVDDDFAAAGLGGDVPMTVVGRLPRLPGGTTGARLVDLDGLLRRSDELEATDSVQVWSDDAGALDSVREELRARGVELGDVTSVGELRTTYDATPAAWSLALSVLVGGAAVLVTVLVMVVATATSWRARATDLAALRMAGLPDRAVRRLELLGQLPVVVTGAVAGAACGVVAAVVALPAVRQFTEAPEVDTTDFSTPWALVLAAAAAALLLLLVVAVVASRWTVGRARYDRIREGG